MKKFNLLTICALLLFSNWLYGQIETDRPDHTEGTSAVPQGALQIESGIQLAYRHEDQLSQRQIMLPATLFRYGIAKGIELRLDHSFENIKDENRSKTGFGDLSLGSKINLYSGEKSGIAFITSVTIPTGNTGFSHDP